MNPLEQLTKISLLKKVLILFVLCLIIGLGFWFLYYNPQREDVIKIQKAHARLIAKRKDAERRKKTYDMDRLRRDELRKLYTEQLRALPLDTEMSSFLNNITSQGEMVGLEILSVKPRKQKVAKYYARIPVALRLRGSYHQLAKFFYLVGNLDRIINIEDIRLSKFKISDLGVVLTADVLATTFRAVNPDKKKRK
jgi:type IV pilus assembly protein PilO